MDIVKEIQDGKCFNINSVRPSRDMAKLMSAKLQAPTTNKKKKACIKQKQKGLDTE